MNASETQLSVWSGTRSACVKVTGRANFSASVAFKAAILCLQERGCLHFMLDLTDCLLMDSTFVGVLAGLGRVMQSDATQNPSNHRSIEIFNPNPRITDLLDNLGVTGLFKIVQGRLPDRQKMTEIKLRSGTPNRLEIARTCLDAHRTLAEIKPDDDALRGVTQCFEEDLRRQQNKDT